MRKKRTLLLLAVLCSLSAPLEAKAWRVHTSTDKMSGKVTNYVIAYSENVLAGWLRKGKILLGHQCGGGIYLRANDLGFHVDNIDCGSYGCLRVQYVRIKFDSSPPENVQFSVWEDNHDGMSLVEMSNYTSRRNDKNVMIEKMKSSAALLVEIQLFNTKGEEKIAEFDLVGFGAALLHCRE